MSLIQPRTAPPGASSQPKLVCRTLSAHEEIAYLEFAGKAWGTGSPQASASFLAWLYQENPHALGMENDLLVVAAGDQIVGAHHRMRIPWRISGQRVVVPSLHDLAILESHRHAEGQQRLIPPGAQLMLAALQKEKHVALFGLNQIADNIYDRMKIPVVPVYWLRKVRSRIRAGMQTVGSRLRWMPSVRQPARCSFSFRGYEVTKIVSPADDELDEALAVAPAAQTCLDWDRASFRWRFFHDAGPRNILLLARKGRQPYGRAVISIGLKSGIVVARLAELVFQDTDSLKALCSAMENTFSELKVPVCLAVTSSQEAASHLVTEGWNYRKEPIGARWFTRKGEPRPEDFWICGGAWDFGCDSRIEQAS